MNKDVCEVETLVELYLRTANEAYHAKMTADKVVPSSGMTAPGRRWVG